MKKYLVILGAAVLVMALASPSMAQFQSWGFLQVEQAWTKNWNKFDNDRGDDNRRSMSERFRFFLQYGDPKTARAVIGFEADSAQWGELAAPSSADGPGLAQKNRMGSLGADSLALEIKNAYMDFVIPNTPLSLMAGIQTWAVGGAVGRYWLYVDAPGLRLTAKFAPHTIEAAWYKEYKQDLYKDNDSDMYMLKYNLSQKQYSVEAWLAYENDMRSKTTTGALAASTVSSTVTQYNFQVTKADRNYNSQIWWAGIGAPFTIGNFRIDPLLIYEFGKARKYFTGTDNDVKVSAWLASLEASYQIGPGMKLTAHGYYTSGNDKNKSDKQNLYTIPNAAEGYDIIGNGWSVFFFGNSELSYYLWKEGTNIGGYWFGRLSFTYSPLSWLELQPTYFYVGDTTKNGNTIGRTDKDEKSVGHEINLIATLKIYNNLTYKAGFGYFLPGKVFEGNYSRTSGSPADNAWALTTRLSYTF